MVIEKCNGYSNVRTNVIYERAVFNRLCENDFETVDEFITSLFAQVGKSKYGALRKEMIGDRIVVWIKDKCLSEKLQLNPELTLEKAVAQVRNAELLKAWRKNLRETYVTESSCKRANAQRRSFNTTSQMPSPRVSI